MQLFLNGQTPDSLFIFVLFKQKFTAKTVSFSRIQTRIVGVQGKCVDHLTTLMTTYTTFQSGLIHAKIWRNILSSSFQKFLHKNEIFFLAQPRSSAYAFLKEMAGSYNSRAADWNVFLWHLLQSSSFSKNRYVPQ